MSASSKYFPPSSHVLANYSFPLIPEICPKVLSSHLEGPTEDRATSDAGCALYSFRQLENISYLIKFISAYDGGLHQ